MCPCGIKQTFAAAAAAAAVGKTSADDNISNDYSIKGGICLHEQVLKQLKNLSIIDFGCTSLGKILLILAQILIVRFYKG